MKQFQNCTILEHILELYNSAILQFQKNLHFYNCRILEFYNSRTDSTILQSTILQF